MKDLPRFHSAFLDLTDHSSFFFILPYSDTHQSLPALSVTLLWEIHCFPSCFQSHPSTRSAPVLELLGRSLPLPHVAARLSYGRHHKHIPCSSMKKVSPPKNKMPVVFSPALKNLLSLISNIKQPGSSHQTRSLPPHGIFVCLLLLLFSASVHVFTSSHTVPIYGLYLPIF